MASFSEGDNMKVIATLLIFGLLLYICKELGIALWGDDNDKV